MLKRTITETILTLLLVSCLGCQNNKEVNNVNEDKNNTTIESSDKYIDNTLVTEDNFEELYENNIKEASFTKTIQPAEVGELYWNEETQKYEVGNIKFDFIIEDKHYELLGQNQDSKLWMLFNENDFYVIVSDFDMYKSNSGIVKVVNLNIYNAIEKYYDKLIESGHLTLTNPINVYGGVDERDINFSETYDNVNTPTEINNSAEGINIEE